MSADQLSIALKPAAPSFNTASRLSQGALLGASLRSVENNATSADAKELEDAQATLDKTFDSLDEASAAANRYRQLRNRGSDEGASATLQDASAGEDDEEHVSRIDKIFKILDTDSRSSARALLQQMRRLFPDPSDLVMVLRQMLQNSHLSRTRRKRLEETLELAEEEADEKQLKAGINVALKAKMFGKKLALSPAIIRQAYRDFLESDADELMLYQSWVALFGAAKRGLIVDFMEAALTADMEASEPSCKSDEFRALLGKLVQLKHIRSADNQFMRRFLSGSVVKQLQHSEERWLFFLFTIMRTPDLLRLAFIDAAGDTFSALTPRQQSETLSWLRSCLAMFAHACYHSAEHRSLLIDRLSELSTSYYQTEIHSEGPP